MKHVTEQDERIRKLEHDNRFVSMAAGFQAGRTVKDKNLTPEEIAKLATNAYENMEKRVKDYANILLKFRIKV